MPEVELMSDDKNNNDSGKKSLRPAVHSDIEFTVEEIPEATVSEKMMEKKQTWRSITISARDAGSAPGSAAKEP